MNAPFLNPRQATPAHGFTLAAVTQRMQQAHATHLGYPYNLVGHNPVPDELNGFLVNNLGDPYVGSHYASEVCDLEREAISWLMNVWHCENHDDYWGSIGTSGTEGNFWALYLAREALPNAVLLHSDDSHYSLPKSGRILRIESRKVASTENGEFSLKHLKTALQDIGNHPVILALTCGTTVKGAHDDIAGAIALLDEMGFGPERRFIHVDGALNAMVLPFANNAPLNIQASFKHAIDSISTSGHKMIGTPMPCGALVTKRKHVERIASAVAYLRSNDTTLMGSRNGHAVLAMWSRFMKHGVDGYTRDVAACLSRTDRLVTTLRAEQVPVLCNPFSLTVVFPKPSEEIVKTYQLACTQGIAHAIVMPNVTDALLQRFEGDYLNWWLNTKENIHAAA